MYVFSFEKKDKSYFVAISLYEFDEIDESGNRMNGV